MITLLDLEVAYRNDNLVIKIKKRRLMRPHNIAELNMLNKYFVGLVFAKT